ncbi:MAG TPA: ABC transporter ATP-binding protein [Candidatus Dormibacteraeota bacterium]|nr:ABC transporter ATP-binding protein [Candidatus Dormibacteraeota bacterium]
MQRNAADDRRPQGGQTDTLLEVRGLSVAYGAAPAVTRVSFELPAGKAVVVLGPNGAGKSSLARAITGLVKPTEGSVLFCGEDVTGMAAHKLARRGISLVPEDRGIFRGLSVMDNLRMALRNGVARNRREASLDKVLTLFPVLGSRRRQIAGTLSGGEQQMLALARVMAGEARVLVVDEPSLGLAPQLVDRVYEALSALRASGLSLLLIEQFVERALDFGDDACLLSHGRVELHGPPSEVRDDILKSYLGRAEEAGATASAPDGLPAGVNLQTA